MGNCPLTFQVLGEISLRHVVVDLSSFVGGDVSRWIATFVYELFEQGVDIAGDGLPIECCLHLVSIWTNLLLYAATLQSHTDWLLLLI